MVEKFGVKLLVDGIISELKCQQIRSLEDEIPSEQYEWKRML